MDEETEGSWWRHVLERALPFLIGIPLVLALGALLYQASTAARDRESALSEQQRSYEIIALARRLDGSIAKAESTLARYVISMDANTGRLYQQHWSRAAAELGALERATRGDAAQHHLVEKLSFAFRDRGQTLSDIALRTTYDQKMTSLGKFHQAGTAQNLTEIGSDLDAIIAAEMERLRARNLDVIRTGDKTAQLATTSWLVGLVLLVAILVTAWVARGAFNDRRIQRRLTRDEAARALALEKAVAVRTAELQLAYVQLQQESTDRAAAEESLRQMQKMEAVGQLTGGIAHDFNNMLAVVVGGLELARRRLMKAPEEAARHIDNAMEGANRASALTRRLLAFARAEPHLPDATNPDELVSGMGELIDRTIGDQIRVTFDLAANDWAIYVDRYALENAILNLAVNARDAMEGKGTLTLATRQRRLAAGEVGECVAGEYLSLAVTDTGCGMPPEVLDRVFEPFFTTKPAGQGTGLGLSQIFGFVGQYGGEIRIQSKLGEGTTVEMFLPRHHGVAAPSTISLSGGASENATSGEPGGDVGLSILVVEDDPRVLAQTRAALTELGHNPICCDSPLKAPQMLQANPDVRLILSDVLMPDMTGPEMIASLPPACRAIPVIFVTGYAGDVSDNRLFEGHGLLRKPYTLAALANAIADAVSELPGSQTTAAAE
nr:ATP-binding protein [Sphingobium subterraneum]